MLVDNIELGGVRCILVIQDLTMLRRCVASFQRWWAETPSTVIVGVPPCIPRLEGGITGNVISSPSTLVPGSTLVTGSSAAIAAVSSERSIALELDPVSLGLPRSIVAMLERRAVLLDSPGCYNNTQMTDIPSTHAASASARLAAVLAAADALFIDAAPPWDTPRLLSLLLGEVPRLR